MQVVGFRGAVELSFAALALMLSACSGGYGGAEQTGNAPRPDGGSGGARDMEEHFKTRVQPELGICRTCHVPNGAGDVEKGRRFMLASDPASDLTNLKASWERLGRNNPTSRILLMASGQEPHTGGALWPRDGNAYKAADILFKCFANPEGCAALLGGSPPPSQQLPLLGSARGGHVWFDFCAGKPDSALLPPDPRSLVRPGIDAGKHVVFNAYWRDCHADPELVQERATPKTCGELRESVAQGERLMKGNGAIGTGTFFAGDDPNGGAQGNGQAPAGSFSLTAEQYNNLWRLWGLTERPANFDDLVAERYGAPRTLEPNPYPKPGEDPNKTNGGSGQLSAFFTQLRRPDGSWTGRIGMTCHGCHSTEIGNGKDKSGPGLLYGSGNSLADTGLTARELAVAGLSPVGAFSLFGTSRGTNNASIVNIAFLADQEDGLRIDPYLMDVLLSGSTASGDTPAWWNLGHRPLKFQDGYFAGDASRVDLIFYKPQGGDGQASDDWVRKHAPAANDWILSLKAPEYPLPVDRSLAEQGAVLFHTKNLWAEGLDNPAPKPPKGNGSCASCHGAYSPRFVNDPAFLADPALEGIASYIVPKSIIRTDTARVDSNNEGVNQFGATSFLGYPETVGTAEDCGPQNRKELRGDREFGYLTPPLYGVWATAPYLHNGSVPTLWDLLKPQDRPKLWRRVSAPAPAGQEGRVVMGFDTHMERAFDQVRLGWKYEVLSCGTGTLPFVECDPVAPTADPFLQQLLSMVYGRIPLSWNAGNAAVIAQLTPQQIEDRKIYNTHLFSQGNEGHDFTAVLTDLERRALIEYLKTL